MAPETPSRGSGCERTNEPGGPSVDLAHLASQTGGDPTLEREVLLLFKAHSAVDFERLKNAVAEAGRREAAHKIVGSARAIGAGEVARLAAVIENGVGGQADRMAELAVAIEEARRFVSQYLSRREK